MTAFHKSREYIAECDTSQNGDLLNDHGYFGSNVHPYETVFLKANRGIDPTLMNHLTEWHRSMASHASWAVCGSD
jgi:hypothetical protein